MRLDLPLLLRAALVALITWTLWLALNDVLTYPTRVSVLPNLTADAETYHALAAELSATWRNNIPAKFPPMWIGLMALVYSVSGVSVVAGKLISWTGLVALVLLSAWLGRKIYGTAAAWVAAVVCASSAGLRAYVGTLQYEIATATFLLAMLALAVHASASDNSSRLFRRVLVAGLAGAVLILTRETFIVAVLLTAAWIAHRTAVTHTPRAAMLGGALFLAVALTPPVGWATVQSVREGRLIPITEKGPKEFALGNHATANGTYNEPLVGMAQPAGVEFIRSHPRQALVLFGRKVLYFWGVLRDGWNAPRPISVWVWRATGGLLPFSAIAPTVRGGWLLVAFVVSLWFLGRDGLRAWGLLPAIVVAVLLIHAISLSSYRFAVPVLPVVYVVVSGPLARLASAALRLLRVPLLALTIIFAAAIGLAAQFREWPLEIDYAAADLDGLAAANELDTVAGRIVRVADANRGTRPVVLLPDEYLPAGALTVTVRARRLSDAEVDSAMARVVLSHLDGRPACVSDIAAGQLSPERYINAEVRCRLQRDGPATLAVFSLGAADFAIDRVNLRWAR